MGCGASKSNHSDVVTQATMLCEDQDPLKPNAMHVKGSKRNEQSNAIIPTVVDPKPLAPVFDQEVRVVHHTSERASAEVTQRSKELLSVARENFNRWNDALQTRDPKAVASLYSTTELSFLPTVSPEHIRQLDGTEQYFEAFCRKNPFGTITDDSVMVFDGGEAYLHSGMYTFELGEAGARKPVEARFSYAWRKQDGGWKIAHHHSSMRPVDPVAAPAVEKESTATPAESLSMAQPSQSNAAPISPESMLSVARENFNRWNDALQTRDPKAVASLYSTTELSFLPTVSPEHIRQLDGTEQYFEAFCRKNPFGTITDDSVMVFDGGEAYLHSGMYTFELGEAGARKPVEARFSYAWRKQDGGWKIAHHHSSMRPPAPSPPTS